MVRVTRSNPQVFKQLSARFKELDGKAAKAGWFPSSVYENGTPVATAAAGNEFGQTINHPGGTPYKIGEDGRAVFVKKSEGHGLPVTKPHTIIIPPRPFMRPTAVREKNNWIAIMRNGAKAIMAGKATGYQVMDALGLNAAAEIARSITQVFSPPLKKSTIRARLRERADKQTVGLLDKPLENTRLMLDSVNHTVEDNFGAGQ